MCFLAHPLLGGPCAHARPPICVCAAHAAVCVPRAPVLPSLPLSPPPLPEWDGGLVLVSHDFRLIGQVAKEIWEVGGGAVRKWQSDIVSYKAHLKATHEALMSNRKDTR